jgi:hypothetical protein
LEIEQSDHRRRGSVWAMPASPASRQPLSLPRMRATNFVDAGIPTVNVTTSLDIQGILGDGLTVPSYLFREGITEIEE